QKTFNRYVVEMIALDGLPLTVTKGQGFKRLIEFLRPDLNLVSPRTVGRLLDDLAEKCALPALHEELTNVPPRAIHFMVDLWSSRSRASVLGIRVQFIKGWDLKMHTLSFRHFSGHHTGQQIRQAFEAELSQRGVAASQIGSVVCDNASNMTKAFNMSMIFADKWLPKVVESDDGEEPEGNPEECPASEVDVSAALPACRRMRCTAHTLQLAVNDAIRDDKNVTELLKQLNSIINIFRRSPYWTSRLKELCGKDVVPATGTRWNSIISALNRLTQRDVYDSAVTLVEEHNADHPSKTVDLTLVTLPRLEELHNLLKPLGDATDRLQGDGVTSAVVHLCISTCYTQVKTYPAEMFSHLQRQLLARLSGRFAPILEDDLLIAASILDPRQKLRVFQPTFAQGLCKPNPEEAITAVKRLLGTKMWNVTRSYFFFFTMLLQVPGVQHENREPSTSSMGTSSECNALWNTADPYDLLDLVSPVENAEKETELDTYLKSPYSTEDILQFWKTNCTNYPKLARLAVICLGMPASSGSVERLFSVSGALQRARRASLLPETIEKLIL
ncbi:conserved hypothetical protein, partial [Ixodes scapularis]